MSATRQDAAAQAVARFLVLQANGAPDVERARIKARVALVSFFGQQPDTASAAKTRAAIDLIITLDPAQAARMLARLSSPLELDPPGRRFKAFFSPAGNPPE